MFIDFAVMTGASALASTTKVPSVVAAKTSDWSLKNYKINKRTFDDFLLNPAATKTEYSYKSDGPLNIPTLTIKAPVDYSILHGSVSEEGHGPGIDIKTRNGVEHIVPQAIGLASVACLYLDFELNRKLGAWGPECKIEKFLQIPKGILTKDNRPGSEEGDYFYTPRKIGDDALRFILENGAGKKADVTFHLHASSYQGGMLNNYFAESMAGAEASGPLEPLAVPPVFGYRMYFGALNGSPSLPGRYSITFGV